MELEEERVEKSDKKPVLNPELWERLLKALSKHEYEFIWVKGHAGHPENERCDRLAVAQSENMQRSELKMKNVAIILQDLRSGGSERFASRLSHLLSENSMSMSWSLTRAKSDSTARANSLI